MNIREVHKALVNLRDVAKAAKVSLGTASNALDSERASRVSGPVRDRVLAAAKELGYQPRARDIERPPVVAVCGQYDDPNPVSPFNASIMIGLCRGASEMGVNLLVLSGPSFQMRRASADYYFDPSFDALVAYHIEDRNIPVLEKVGAVKPVVALFTRIDSDSIAFLDCDNVYVGRRAAQELLSRGYDRFVLVAGPSTNSNARDRRTGFEEEMRRAGAQFEIVSPECLDSEWDEPYAVYACDRLSAILEERGGNCGVFAWCDSLGIYMMKTGRLDIPSKVGLLGCDGLELVGGLLEEMGLSTVSQGVEEIACEGIRVAERLLNGSNAKDNQTIVKKFVQVIPRKSTLVIR
jgi:DNA-binding LacI/PurR family transcriptional regulator